MVLSFWTTGLRSPGLLGASWGRAANFCAGCGDPCRRLSVRILALYVEGGTPQSQFLPRVTIYPLMLGSCSSVSSSCSWRVLWPLFQRAAWSMPCALLCSSYILLWCLPHSCSIHEVLLCPRPFSELNLSQTARLFHPNSQGT